MAEKKNASAFAKDFGYLMPFLENVAAAADDLEPAARDELRTLLSGSRQRWERVQALLGGAPGAPASAAADSPAPATAPAGAATPPSASPISPSFPPAGFTVGSLRPRS